MALDSFKSAFSGVFRKRDKKASINAWNGSRYRPLDISFSSTDSWVTESMQSDGLQFHPSHGKAIKLLENNCVAIRNEKYFENSVVFSHRPVAINEVVSVEILKMTEEYCGPLKIGFTTIDPATFDNEVPPGRELQEKTGVWLRGTHLLHPIEVGSQIYFELDDEGNVFHGMNGEDAVGTAVIASGIDTSQPVWAILEVYGSVQAFKFGSPNVEFQNHYYQEQESKVDGNNNIVD